MRIHQLAPAVVSLGLLLLAGCVPISPELVAERVATVAAESTARAVAREAAYSFEGTGTSVPTQSPGTSTSTVAATPTAIASATATVPSTPEPAATPTTVPSATPTTAPHATPTTAPSATPTTAPSATPTTAPSATPTTAPSATPTTAPTAIPTTTLEPTTTATPTIAPTAMPTAAVPQAVVPEPTIAVSPAGTAPATMPAAATPVAAVTVTASITPTVAASATITATSTATTAITQTLTTPAVVATVTAGRQTINVRGGPGLQFDIVGTLPSGQALGVIGTNTKRDWWQVCCVNDRPGWISDGVVTFEGQRQAVPVMPPLMPDQLKASWALHWRCYGQGCTQPECLGQSTAQTGKIVDERWLEVKREATWPDKCGQPENWLSEVDRYSGKEPELTGGPLFYIWMGSSPGPESRSVDLLGRKLSLWCTGARTREVDGGQGWTFAYEGEACYDRAAGVLVTLQYTKRWLFTGSFQGNTYNKEYLGTYEAYQQILTDTNVPLSGK